MPLGDPDLCGTALKHARDRCIHFLRHQPTCPVELCRVVLNAGFRRAIGRGNLGGMYHTRGAFHICGDEYFHLALLESCTTAAKTLPERSLPRGCAWRRRLRRLAEDLGLIRRYLF